MLSCHAESLFWTGRYVERAADTARMLDVTYHALLESPHAEAQRTWLELLEVLKLDGPFRATTDHVSARTVTRFLVLDQSNPGAIVPSIGRARENARSVRELISTEIWESINTFWLELQARDLEAEIQHQPYEVYRLVKRRCQEVAGGALETMPHDDGWRFLQLGWMLERAAIVCRLLNVRTRRYTSGEEELEFYAAVELLKSASGLEAFRKSHPGEMSLANVIGFLLLSPTFPRSVLFSVRGAETRLSQLAAGPMSRPQRVLGRLRGDLDYAEPIELLAGDLHAFLDRVEEDLRGITDLVGVQFFRNAEEVSVLHALGVRRMKLDIRYRCSFEYDSLVRESQNELRAAPLSDARQSVLSYRVSSFPAARFFSFDDYWGSRVDTFGVREPHIYIEVIAEATVETHPAPMLTSSADCSELQDLDFVTDHIEYLERTPHADWDDAITAEARRQLEIAGPDAVSVVLAIHRRAGTLLSYRPGTTYVGVPVTELIPRGEGVCQDYAHLAVAMCRSIGIPARYVSGYLFTDDDAVGDDTDTDVVQVQTHAWFEAAIPGVGWLALDPTNKQEVGLRHVKIGHGRDYDDVPPLRGVYTGATNTDLQVGVEMRRLSNMTAAQQQQQQ